MLEAAASGELNTLVLLGADPLSDSPIATSPPERSSVSTSSWQ